MKRLFEDKQGKRWIKKTTGYSGMLQKINSQGSLEPKFLGYTNSKMKVIINLIRASPLQAEIAEGKLTSWDGEVIP